MEKQILEELKELRVAIVKLAGTTDLPKNKQLSPAVLEKAAKEFQKLNLENDAWVTEHDLYKYFKNAHYGVGKFIRKEFKFTNFFIKGKSHYYNKADIQALAKELKARNVNLKRYMELKADKENFNKKIASALSNKKQSKNSPYLLEEGLSDINTSNPPRPSAEIIKEDLKRLEEEFFEYKLEEYIDIYKGNYAMVKFEYHFSKYLKSEIKSRTKRWCENFNYANNALELLISKKSNFIPIKEEERYQL
ncbi:hypothetical protein CPT03_03245 [Pedobacter ginsengisoli]|uniref:Uncharacterized protein n=1 Tax=Pedobacter ginsengisoli TaxID=363852 RepID=A0A2D1U1Q8_9SPHI|nr:hypothetical protein [Pedobacter ginsengisoli]ATP55546.1 hypothetical protein CPT03_03245 [Pedobacter ginsengisoli]